MKQDAGVLLDVAVFVQVVDTGSFTAAAERLGVAKSAVSKSVSRLESHLGVRLLNRTTRRLSLTEEGERLHLRSAPALEEIRDAEREVAVRQAQVRGRLRVAAPMSFGLLHLAPRLPEFMQAHPLLRIDLRLEDRFSEVVGSGLDVTLRIAELADSSFIARRLCTIRHVTVASPEYLARCGAPTHPHALRDHACLVFGERPQSAVWRYHDAAGQAIDVSVDGVLQSNNSLALREALLRGVGIALTPSFVVGDDLRAGRLVPLLTDFAAPERGLYALLAERRHVPAKTRAFIEFAAACFREPAWDRPACSSPRGSDNRGGDPRGSKRPAS